MHWIKKLLLTDKPLWIRIWLYTALLAIFYYVIKSEFHLALHKSSEADLIIMAYGSGSVGLLLLIYGFDWK